MNRREFLASAAVLAVQDPVPSRRLKVAQVGTAHGHADGKLATLLDLPALYEVVGVCEPDPARREAARRRAPYQGLPFLPEADLLALPGLDVVAVETEVPDLVPAARRAVAAGKHVHLDKPAGPSLPAFRSLLDEARERKRLVQLGYMFRYNPAFQLLRRAVQEGWLGELFEINGVIGKKSAPAQRPGHAPQPGGTMYELGGHLADVLVALAGKPDRVHAHARSLGGDGRADNQLAVFEYPKLLATLRSEIVDPFGSPRRQFSVAGTKGALEIRPLEPPQVVLSLDQARGEYKAGTQAVKLPVTGGRYHAELTDLAAAVAGTKALPYGPDHDLAVHEALLRASGMNVE